MESVGERLNKERKRKGLSIHDVATVTKIQPRFIQALEEDRFEILPSSVFIKGFLKSYASCLGMDPEEVIELYREQFAQQAQQKSLVKEGGGGTLLEVEALPAGHRKRRKGPWKFLAFVFAVFFLFWAGRYLYGRWQAPPGEGPRPEESGTPSPLLVPESPPGPSAPGGKGMSGALPQEGALERRTEVPPPEATKSQGKEPLVLSVVAQEEAWIRVEIDGKDARQLFLKAGQSRQWKASEGFLLTIGNASAVRVHLNGKAVALPPAPGNVLRGFRIQRELAG
ncbi:MAG: DUF4115 domain-containing protein [Candidatus Tectomicrobia bacterium]|uniref:DUF4115 domain-containing protein n=1 Tax=Tectimicrobiota bacterium TaxID=2528274 RepID=A0A932CLF8_UNCTE|nr:DUF4115 domain-containing protein [Candidatus Tectomicrobia bacterium]